MHFTQDESEIALELPKALKANQCISRDSVMDHVTHGQATQRPQS